MANSKANGSRKKGGRSSSATRKNLAVVNKTPQTKVSAKRNRRSAQQSKQPTFRVIPAILDRVPVLVTAVGPWRAFALVVLAILAATGSSGFIVVTVINALRH